METFKVNNIENKKFNYFKKHFLVLTLALLSLLPAKEGSAQNIESKDVGIENSIGNSKQEKIDKYRQDFNSIDNLFKERAIEEKVSYLKEKFGQSIYNFLSIHDINNDINLYNKVKNNLNSDETFVKDDVRFSTPGSLLSKHYAKWIDNKTEVDYSMEYTDVDKVIDFSVSELIEYIDNKYPKGYLENSTNSIVYVKQPNDLYNDMIKVGEVESFGMKSLIEEKKENEIKIYNVPGGINKDMFLSILDHEIHHPNDWNNSKILNSADRIEMLYDFSKRSESDNRFKTDYLENINEGNLGIRFDENTDMSEFNITQTLSYVKTTEYFAEVLKEYFNNPKNLSAEDYNLAKKWVDKIQLLSNNK